MIEVDGIKTYSNKAALEALARYAAHVKEPDTIVEIGVYRGGSLKTIAEAAQVDVCGVDTWGLEGAYASGSEKAEKYGIENMRIAEGLTGHLQNVTLVRGFSADVAGWMLPRVGMLYIDGEHTYSAAWSDFRSWKGHLREGSVVAFDDYTTKPQHSGVRDAVNEIRDTYLDDFKVFGNRLAVGFYNGME